MSDQPPFNESMHAALNAARAGNLARARDILERVARSSPVNDGFFALYLDVLEAQRDWPALGSAARTWQANQPALPRVYEAQAQAAWETGLLHEALELYRRALSVGGSNAARLATYARLCLNALEFERAGTALDEAEALDSNNVHMLSAKAAWLMFAGRLEEAEGYCRRSLAANPHDVAALRLLVTLRHGRLSAPDREVLRRLSQQTDLRVEHRISAAFALGDCYDAEGAIDEAFAAYQLAQRLSAERGRSESLTYEPERMEREVDQLLARFSSAAAAAAPPPPPPAAPAPRPLFIVGMPRSGTTLIESVIGSHSRVFACGERMIMRQLKREYLSLAASGREVPATTLGNFAQAYFGELPRLDGRDHITDKNPWNFDAVGLILKLLPQAHVIHVRRNPLDTGLSIFRHEFPKFQPFTQRLEDIGHYYGQYARLMAHWQGLAGPRMTTIQYEDFVASFAERAPALLRACGLEWEASCADFQNRGPVIATLSAVQARQALTDRSGRARRYARHLAPLVEALEAAGVDLETGQLES